MGLLGFIALLIAASFMKPDKAIKKNRLHRANADDVVEECGCIRKHKTKRTRFGLMSEHTSTVLCLDHLKKEKDFDDSMSHFPNYRRTT